MLAIVILINDSQTDRASGYTSFGRTNI